MVWSEYSAADTSPRMGFLRTLSASDEALTVVSDPLTSTQERLWLLATTQDRALGRRGHPDAVIAWTVLPVGGGSGALYVLDRVGDGDSVVRLPDGVLDDLRASGGLVTWTSTDTTAENPADTSYLYRATASVSGHDGPDLARFPGGSVTASLAGDRTAWLENAGARQWLVEGTIVPVLERG